MFTYSGTTLRAQFLYSYMSWCFTKFYRLFGCLKLYVFFLGVGLYLLYLTFHKHFPPNHRLHKICNRNVIKLSYSYTPNMASFISAHNRKLLNKDDNSAKKPCNCRDKANCPMPEGCRDRGVVYEARVECNGNTRIYNRLCETEFKTRFYNHVQSFKNRSKSKATELSKFIWNCKDADPSISWITVYHANSYQHSGRHCNLCLAEKFIILTADPNTTLNKRTGGRSRAHLVMHSRSHMTYNLGVVTESDHEIFLARKTCVFLSESQEEVRALVQQLFIANRV